MENSKLAIQKIQNQRMIWSIKAECHRLMVFLFGSDTKGRKRGYIFLKTKFGKTIHFKDINDYKTLFLVRKELYEYAISKDILSVDELNDFFKTL